ncbi:MAG: hypothetical protein ACLP1Y_00385 [Candidatus Acidiferrales bacterium]
MSSSVRALGSGKNIQGLVIGLGILALTWELAAWIVAGQDRLLLFSGLAIAVVAATIYILNDWRSGFYIFVAWLMFEDLARKFLGNNMLVFFAKDFLVAVVYLSCLIARKRRQFESFRPPFWLPLSLFFWLLVVQVFNTGSPSIFYGLLGLKLYVYYLPLMFVAYALVRTPEELNRFMTFSVILAVVISTIGLWQETVSMDFLSPANLAPELVGLGRLTRMSPLTHQLIHAPTGVFVSSGRFADFLILMWIIAMGELGYVFLSRRPGAKYAILALGTITAGTMLCAIRHAIIFTAISILTMSAAFLWGAPWHWGQGHRLSKAIRRTFLVGAASLLLLMEFSPAILGAHWAFLSETMDPTRTGSQFHSRVVEYPLDNLEKAFDHPDWILGYGTGTASMGSQYVARILGAPPSTSGGVENGFGTLLIELGILGLLLWLVWTGTMLYFQWGIVRKLRQTVYFPIAFAIFWYSFLLLIPLTYLTISPYENFVNNAYLWILTGIMFRLPQLAKMPQPVPVAKRSREPLRFGMVAGSQ